MALPIDLARVETAAFETTSAHQALSRFVGSWRGPARLWLQPDGAPEETSAELHAELVLGGRWLRLTYHGVAFARPHAGEMLLGYHKDAGQYELAWIDSSHTGSAIMISTGAAGEQGIVDVLGSYAAGPERWGWRTRLQRTASGELALDAFNVTPAGVEDRAMAWLLTPVT
jgi:uncharacterized protein DUF1579